MLINSEYLTGLGEWMAVNPFFQWAVHGGAAAAGRSGVRDACQGLSNLPRFPSWHKAELGVP